MIVVINGLRTTKNSSEKQKFFESIDNTVLQYTIDYNFFESEIKKIKKELNAHPKILNSNLMFIGTSMGGFVAEYLATEFYGKLIMINPCLEPKTVGLNLEIYKINRNGNGIPGCVILDKNDEVINSKITYEILKDRYQIHTFEGEGHRFIQFETFRETILELYNFVPF